MQWLLHPPTPQVFISYILDLYYDAEEKIELNDIAVYIVELSVHDYYFTSSKPSVLALSALSIATHMLGHSQSWIGAVLEDLRWRDCYEEVTKIDACRDRLNRLYANTGTKLEDFLDLPSQSIDTNIQADDWDEVCKKISPTSVIS